MKTELKNLTQLSNYCCVQGYYFCQKNADFLQENAGTIKIKRALVLKLTFSKTTYVYILTYQISLFWHNSNKF